MPDTKDDDEVRPELRRGMDRRRFLRGELSRSALETARHLPGLGGLLGHAMRETAEQREERMVHNLWLLLMGRVPKPEESEAGLQVVRNASTPEEKGDALVDILWALTQTQEFEELGRPDRILVRGLYKIALDRLPETHEEDAAVQILKEVPDASARAAALEGLFTALVRSFECVLRRPDPPRRNRFFPFP